MSDKQHQHEWDFLVHQIRTDGYVERGILYAWGCRCGAIKWTVEPPVTAEEERRRKKYGIPAEEERRQ
jgi:hypothetical protein